MAALATPGKEPGTLNIPALGRTIKLVEWREDDFFDTVSTADPSQAAATVTAGTSFEFFRDLNNKNLQHTNLRTARRIPAGSEFIMARIGVMVCQAFGNVVALPDDVVKIAYAATLSFKINDRLVSEGPLYKFQSGYGVTGSVSDTNTTVKSGYVTIGVPSAAAAPSLMVAQPVMDDDDLMATLNFASNAWATGAVQPSIKGMAISLLLHGFIKKPQGK